MVEAGGAVYTSVDAAVWEEALETSEGCSVQAFMLLVDIDRANRIGHAAYTAVYTLCRRLTDVTVMRGEGAAPEPLVQALQCLLEECLPALEVILLLLLARISKTTKMKQSGPPTTQIGALTMLTSALASGSGRSERVETQTLSLAETSGTNGYDKVLLTVS